MAELFPTTHATWLRARLEEAPDDARRHVMERYLDPLVAYARASSLRGLGEPGEIVSDFLTSRLSDPDYLARWKSSGLPLRRWLVNGLIAHARNRGATEARRRARVQTADPVEIDRAAAAPETDALLALERAWAMRVMIEAHDRIRSELEAEGRSAWWELFRLHSVHGLDYERSARVTGVARGSASHVNRVVATRLRESIASILRRDGIREEDLDRELALLQDLLG